MLKQDIVGSVPLNSRCAIWIHVHTDVYEWTTVLKVKSIKRFILSFDVCLTRILAIFVCCLGKFCCIKLTLQCNQVVLFDVTQMKNDDTKISLKQHFFNINQNLLWNVKTICLRD